MKKRGQVGVEYMIIISFITFAITATLLLAYSYSRQIEDQIKINEIEGFVLQVINAAENVYFSGEPSKTTVSLYLPHGVNEITITTNSIVVKTQTGFGESVREFESRVPLSGSINPVEGTKNLIIEAKADYVEIN